MALKIEQYENQETLANQAANIVVAEALACEKQNKTLALIVPTGSTAIPFYKKLVEKWEQGIIDLSNVLFFNMDEYAGLSKDNPNSYYSFMQKHFYQYVLNQPKGVPEAHANIPNFSGSETEIQDATLKYGEKIAEVQASSNFRVVLFGGIGRGPAHIAFNDFTEEFRNISDQDREGLAKGLGTRMVPLDAGTRNANKRFFNGNVKQVPKFAISIGFKEILASDRIIIMANDPSKKEAVQSLIKTKPSYKVPASLLKLAEEKVTIMLSKDCCSQENFDFSPKINSSQAMLWVPSLYKNENAHMEQFIVKPETKTLVIQDDEAWPNEQVLATFLPEETKYLRLSQDDLNKQIRSIEPELIVLPHTSLQFAKMSSLKRLLHDEYITKGKKIQFIRYETDYGIISGNNLLIGLTQAELERQKEALLNHSSQLSRNDFQNIAYEKARDFEVILGAQEHPVPNNSIGVEAFKYYKLKNGSLTYKTQRPNPFSFPWGKKDEIIIVSPHPDDAEIGCGGLIQRLGQLQNSPHVLNVSSGNRASVKLSDLNKHPNPDPELIRQAKASVNANGEITDADLRGKIRQYESSRALAYLANGIKLQALDLEFYTQKSEPSKNDHRRVATELGRGLLNSIRKDGQLVLFVPNPIDAHQTHRTVSRLFLDEVRKLSYQHPKMEMDIVYYQTPWTGRHNLFLYTDHPKASKSKALIGAERISQLGQSALSVTEQNELTKGKKALAFILSDRI